VDLAPQRLEVQVPAEEDRFERLAQLGECLVGRVLGRRAREAAQDRLGVGGPEAQGGGVLDQLVVLAADQPPVDRPRQDRLES
jgi:hypothetical protein